MPSSTIAVDPPRDSQVPLKAGDKHYRAFVGPPEKYDLMAAHQFELLYQLGLRGHHRLLDIGCGSLRAGRLLIFYLDPGNYFGIEPQQWLLQTGIEENIGREAVDLRRPRFDHNEEFTFACFETVFDYALAQSIFSHASQGQIQQCFQGLKECLSPEGIFIATFILGPSDYMGDEWVYPGCVTYREQTVRELAHTAGFHASKLEADHPNRQTWFAFGKDREVVQPLDGQYIGLAATERLGRLNRHWAFRFALAVRRALRIP